MREKMKKIVGLLLICIMGVGLFSNVITTNNIKAAGESYEWAILKSARAPYPAGALIINPQEKLPPGQVVSKGTWSGGPILTSASDISKVTSLYVDGETVCFSDMSYAFSGLTNLATFDFTNFDWTNVDTMEGLFQGDTKLANINMVDMETQNVKNTSKMFSGCAALKTLDFSQFNVKSVEYIAGMFLGCTNLETIYVARDFNLEQIKDIDEIVFSGSDKLVGKGSDSTECHASTVGATQNGEFARIPTAANPNGFLTFEGSVLTPEAVILSNTYKDSVLTDDQAIANASSKGSLAGMLNGCLSGSYVRLVEDIDLSWSEYQEDDSLNNRIYSSEISGSPSAIDIAGHKLTLESMDIDSGTALIDTSSEANGTIDCPYGNIAAEYNAQSYIPIYSSDNYARDTISVDAGYHLFDLKFSRGCFTFNPKTANLSTVNNAKAGFGTYTKILGGTKAPISADKTVIRNKALLVLSEDDIADTCLEINFEDLAAISNDGGVKLHNQKDVNEITLSGEKTDSISFRTTETSTIEGEIERSESLRASIKSYALSCLESGATNTFFSARYYLTDKIGRALTDRFLTHIKFNISIRSAVGENYEITSWKVDDKTI